MLFFLFGCLTGNSYPKQLASTTCETAFQCLDQDLIEDYFGYKDINDCIEEIEDTTRDSDAFSDWKNGSKDFIAENAEACLIEVKDVQNDSDCNGDMNALFFFGDIYTQECYEVYQ